MVWKLNIEDQTVHLKRERKWWWWRQQEVDKLNRSTSALAVIGLHCNSASWPEMHFLKCTQSVHCSAASFKCTGLYFVMQSTFLQVETVTYSTTLNIVKRSPLTRVEKLSFLTKIRTGLMSNYVPKVSEVLRSHLKIIFTFHIFTSLSPGGWKQQLVTCWSILCTAGSASASTPPKLPKLSTQAKLFTHFEGQQVCAEMAAGLFPSSAQG